MKLRMLLLLGIALLARGARAEDAPKTYDLSTREKPVVGRKVRIASDLVMTMTLTFRGGDEPSKSILKEKKQSYVGTSEVVTVRDGKEALAKILFAKAVFVEDGKPVPYGFEGKPVSMRLADDDSHEFVYDDGTKLEGADLEAMRGALGYGKKGEPSGEEIFLPDRPVSVGESWVPAMEKLLAASPMAGFDRGSSKATMTLTSVRVRDGSEFAKIDGAFDLVFPKLGPTELVKPALFHMAIQVDTCIDGTSPEGRAVVEGSVSGVSPPKGEGGRFLTVDGSLHVERIVEIQK